MTKKAITYSGEKDHLFNKWCWDSYMQKNKAGLFSHTMYKDKVKMDERLKCKT